jgi:SAM-dependent methyltransferase
MWNTLHPTGEDRPVPVADPSDAQYLAALYDIVNNHDGPDEACYLGLARSADRVLDVGCGTGAMLHRARADGHRGRLVGLDPDPAMLAQARRRADIEWVEGFLPDAGFDAEFDLVYMTGHAVQVLLDDRDIRELFAAVHDALAPGGHFAFETRNPHARAWQCWTPDHAVEVVGPDGRTARVWHVVERVGGEFVTFTETVEVAGRREPLVSRSTLRFLPAEALDRLLAAAGFVVDERYGDWDRSPLTPAAREIITVARPGAAAR